MTEDSCNRHQTYTKSLNRLLLSLYQSTMHSYKNVLSSIRDAAIILLHVLKSTNRSVLEMTRKEKI